MIPAVLFVLCTLYFVSLVGHGGEHRRGRRLGMAARTREQMQDADDDRVSGKDAKGERRGQHEQERGGDQHALKDDAVQGPITSA